MSWQARFEGRALLLFSFSSIAVTFINRDGSESDIRVPIGTNMLQAAHDNDIDLEGERRFPRRHSIPRLSTLQHKHVLFCRTNMLVNAAKLVVLVLQRRGPGGLICSFSLS